MINYGTKPRDRSEQMIMNNYLAMVHLREIKDEPLTPERACEIHRIVTEGTLDHPDGAGRLQSNPDPDDRVGIFGGEDNLDLLTL